MMTIQTSRKHQQGAALVIALFYVVIFSSLSLALFSLSSGNLLMCENIHQSNTALGCAESGMETLRYYASRITLPGATVENERFATFAALLQSDLDGFYEMTYDSGEAVVTIGSSASPVDLDTGSGFYATITPDGTDGVTLCVTGTGGTVERTIQAGFAYVHKQASVFDYGIATKGPVQLGNLSLSTGTEGANNIYIESLDDAEALDIQNAQIDGDIFIVNPDAVIGMSGGRTTIGGETGQSAVDNHVQTGVPAVGFPVPDPAYFEQYVDGITIDSSTDNNFFKANSILENVRIAPNTNPKFTGNVEIMGILYIESPNVVEFSGHCDVTGIIVAAGDYTDNSGDNTLTFQGSVGSQSAATLPDETRYDGLRGETGVFLMASGFSVSFGGNFDTLNGCIIANGIVFFGSAGGEIDGTILNYSDETMELRGDDLVFNRSQTQQSLAGFMPDIRLQYTADSYEEIRRF